MKVREAMTRNARFCRPEDTLDKVGETMILVDCGVLPVVSGGKVVAVITDRDVCLLLTRSDRRPSEVTVEEAMSTNVAACHPHDDIHSALQTMRRRKVRRLPVIGEADELLGLLSLDDVALWARALESDEFKGPFYVEIGETLKAINQQPLAAAAGPRSAKARASNRSKARPPRRIGA